MSLRMIGRRVGLGRTQVSRILDAMATGDPEQVTSALADAGVDADDDMADAGPCSQWTPEQQARAYLSKLRAAEAAGDGAMRDLILYRLRHVMPPGEFAKLCERERIGRSGT